MAAGRKGRLQKVRFADRIQFPLFGWLSKGGRKGQLLEAVTSLEQLGQLSAPVWESFNRLFVEDLRQAMQLAIQETLKRSSTSSRLARPVTLMHPRPVRA